MSDPIPADLPPTLAASDGGWSSASLRIVRSSEAAEVGQVLHVPRAGAGLGRALDNELPLQAMSVSRYHARLIPTERGLLISDFGSSNGIRVNGRQVTNEFLSPGDRVTLGSVELEVRSGTSRDPTLRVRIDPVPDAVRSAAIETGIAIAGFQLHVLRSPDSSLVGRVIPLGDEVVTLGSRRQSTVRIVDPKVSKKHAHLLLTPRGPVLVDAGSTNGTWVDGARAEHRLLHPPQRFRMGGTEIEVRGPAVETGPAAGPLCPHCGTRAADGARFCHTCGSPAPSRPHQIEPYVPTCGGCGQPLDPGARFCAFCGRQVPTPSAPPLDPGHSG